MSEHRVSGLHDAPVSEGNSLKHFIAVSANIFNALEIAPRQDTFNIDCIIYRYCNIDTDRC